MALCVYLLTFCEYWRLTKCDDSGCHGRISTGSASNWRWWRRASATRWTQSTAYVALEWLSSVAQDCSVLWTAALAYCSRVRLAVCTHRSILILSLNRCPTVSKASRSMKMTTRPSQQHRMPRLCHHHQSRHYQQQQPQVLTVSWIFSSSSAAAATHRYPQPRPRRLQQQQRLSNNRAL